MSTSHLFQSDYRSFFLKGKPFVPSICSETPTGKVPSFFNTVSIVISGELESTLDWDDQIEKAKAFCKQGKLLFWELDLGLEHLDLSYKNSLMFSSHACAINHFNQTVWPQFCDQSIGISFYKGSLDLEKRLKWNVDLQESYKEWMLSRLAERSSLFLKREYAHEIFAEYFHQLLALLPETLQGFIFFEIDQDQNPSQLFHLVSKERYSHFHLGLKNSPIPLGGICWETGAARGGYYGKQCVDCIDIDDVSIGVCFPLKNMVCDKAFLHYNHLFKTLDALEIRYRIIPEFYLTEQWDQLDYVLYHPSYLSPQGKRKIQGFVAAGGKSIAIENLHGEEDFSLSLESFRGRGI